MADDDLGTKAIIGLKAINFMPQNFKMENNSVIGNAYYQPVGHPILIHQYNKFLLLLVKFRMQVGAQGSP